MITYEALIRFAKTIEGETLETSARQRPFTVSVAKNGLIFTIENGNSRLNHKTSTEKVLGRFNKMNSYKPGDYQDLTVNASSLTRILELMTSDARCNKSS